MSIKPTKIHGKKLPKILYRRKIISPHGILEIENDLFLVLYNDKSDQWRLQLKEDTTNDLAYEEIKWEGDKSDAPNLSKLIEKAKKVSKLKDKVIEEKFNALELLLKLNADIKETSTNAKELEALLQSEKLKLEAKIKKKLKNNEEPAVKLLFDYINLQLDLYQNLQTHIFYEKDSEGRYHKIDEIRLVEFVNIIFGENKISSKKCYECLKFITKSLKKDYDLLEFTNGILNSKTLQFHTNKNVVGRKIPKIIFPFRWNPDAKGGYIKKIVEDTLINEKYPNDYELWLRAVGHAMIAKNRIGKIVIVQGPSKTGKSTLTTILKRMFNHSRIPTSVINENKPFMVNPLIDCDINIDDDINNGMLTKIGFLNTIVTGNGVELAVKHEKYTIKAENEQIPRLFANGNSLPPVLGEGFESRLLFIHAENIRKHTERNELLQSDILNGKYDHELEWLAYTALNTYHQKINQPITTETSEKQMIDDFRFKSYPELACIEEVFASTYEEKDIILSIQVNKIIQKWFLWALKQGKISKEHKKPGTKKIAKAMEQAGYSKTRKSFRIEDSEGYQYEQKYVYEGIQLKKAWKDLLKIE